MGRAEMSLLKTPIYCSSDASGRHRCSIVRLFVSNCHHPWPMGSTPVSHLTSYIRTRCLANASSYASLSCFVSSDFNNLLLSMSMGFLYQCLFKASYSFISLPRYSLFSITILLDMRHWMKKHAWACRRCAPNTEKREESGMFSGNINLILLLIINAVDVCVRGRFSATIWLPK